MPFIPPRYGGEGHANLVRSQRNANKKQKRDTNNGRTNFKKIENGLTVVRPFQSKSIPHHDEVFFLIVTPVHEARKFLVMR